MNDMGSTTPATSPPLSYPPPIADNASILDESGYCLLSLDGGGVRGLSTLFILKHMMNRINFSREEAGLQPKKPCDIFDLIGGTSTGGLIAIMLGRLEMSVDQCINAYLELMEQVFAKRENRSIVSFIGGVKPRFSSQVLETAISKVIRSCGVSLEEKFDNGTKPRCKVFVCTNLQKINAITRLRSYRIPEGCEFEPTVLEAAMATSAAPTYFSDVKIRGSTFIDGALGANNPTFEVEEEARELWCGDTSDIKSLVKCFISVGTGHLGLESVSDKSLKHLVEALQKTATQTDETNRRFLGQWSKCVNKGRCFRFNVDQGLQGIKLAEYTERDRMQGATKKYMDEPGTKARMRLCVENLRLKQHQPDAEIAKALRKGALAQPKQKLPSAPPIERATTSEITELITLGNNQLRQKNLLQAYLSFTNALKYMEADPSTTPKQVSRVCQKLMNTSLELSRKSPTPTERLQHAEQAQKYGQAALTNVIKSGDECMVAQVEFLLAGVEVWKVSLQAPTRSGYKADDLRVASALSLLNERLTTLRRFPNLDIVKYEEQAQKYAEYFGQSWFHDR